MKSAGKETKRADGPSHKKERIKYNDTRLAATWAHSRIQSPIPPLLFPLGKPLFSRKERQSCSQETSSAFPCHVGL